MLNLLWLQSGACSGDTMSLLNSEEPDIVTALRMLDVNLVWHPSLSLEAGDDVINILNEFISGKSRLDIFVVEGTIIRGPENSGRYFMFHNRPFKEWAVELARVAEFVIAAGTCSSFGGIPSSGTNPTDSCGLQFFHEQKGGLLGANYLSRGGFPVINIPGCPAHPDWIVESLAALKLGKLNAGSLDNFNRPKLFYSTLAHHGCPRNEYYEFKASAEEYSQQGCLFENLGCKGTRCDSDCNKRLWLGRTGSCTRGGFPCIACTSPGFPEEYVPYFETTKIEGIPTTLPRDVSKAWYIGITELSKDATPERLKKNATSFKLID